MNNSLKRKMSTEWTYSCYANSNILLSHWRICRANLYMIDSIFNYYKTEMKKYNCNRNNQIFQLDNDNTNNSPTEINLMENSNKSIHSKNNYLIFENVSRCTFAECKSIQELLLHMSDCQLGVNCSTPNCYEYYQILEYCKLNFNKIYSVCRKRHFYKIPIIINNREDINYAYKNFKRLLQRFLPNMANSILNKDYENCSFQHSDDTDFMDDMSHELPPIETLAGADADADADAGATAAATTSTTTTDSNLLNNIDTECYEEKELKKLNWEENEDCASISSDSFHMPTYDNFRKNIKKAKYTNISDTNSCNEIFNYDLYSVRIDGITAPSYLWDCKMKTTLINLLDKLMLYEPQEKNFHLPIDFSLLSIITYPEITEKLIDFYMIKNKLLQNQYEDSWDFIQDIRLMFGNLSLYMRNSTSFSRYTEMLFQIFEKEITRIMPYFGFCCGNMYNYNLQNITCCGQQNCEIGGGDDYYNFDTKYVFCNNCFTSLFMDNLTLTENGNGIDEIIDEVKLNRGKVLRMKNSIAEKFVKCSECYRRQHQICVLHLECLPSTSYVCDACLKKNRQTRPENQYSAKKLQQTKLGKFIEKRINKYLENKNVNSGYIHIRVVSSMEKIVTVKPHWQKYLKDHKLTHHFPYRAKILFAFQEIEGVDTAFFSLHVQEYGTIVENSNYKCVYISYIDSVHFFQPQSLRTSVYHEILIAYLEYANRLGFQKAYIWACPPTHTENDYLFYCHPPDQKIPELERLQEWYKKMLNEAIVRDIVGSYMCSIDPVIDFNLSSPIEYPYFEGDYWSHCLETAISTIYRLQYLPENAPILFNMNSIVSSIARSMEQMHFVVNLLSIQSTYSKKINDPDPIIQSNLMNGRDNFMILAIHKRFEFSTLRRAQFSTLNMLYELHNEANSFD